MISQRATLAESIQENQVVKATRDAFLTPDFLDGLKTKWMIDLANEQMVRLAIRKVASMYRNRSSPFVLGDEGRACLRVLHPCALGGACPERLSRAVKVPPSGVGSEMQAVDPEYSRTLYNSPQHLCIHSI